MPKREVVANIFLASAGATNEYTLYTMPQGQKGKIIELTIYFNITDPGVSAYIKKNDLQVIPAAGGAFYATDYPVTVHPELILYPGDIIKIVTNNTTANDYRVMVAMTIELE